MKSNRRWFLKTAIPGLAYLALNPADAVAAKTANWHMYVNGCLKTTFEKPEDTLDFHKEIRSYFPPNSTRRRFETTNGHKFTMYDGQTIEFSKGPLNKYEINHNTRHSTRKSKDISPLENILETHSSQINSIIKRGLVDDVTELLKAAAIVDTEARGEGDIGLEAVSYVAYNRLFFDAQRDNESKARRYSNKGGDLLDVLTYRTLNSKNTLVYQFNGYEDHKGKIDSMTASTYTPSKNLNEALGALIRVLSGEVKDPTNGALRFFRPKKTQSYQKKLNYYRSNPKFARESSNLIGNHLFWRYAHLNKPTPNPRFRL